MSTPLPPCFPSVPDITGSGARAAIYLQNLLSTLSTIIVLLDMEVTQAELQAMETHSTTIIISSFALLISAVIQHNAKGLPDLHAAIILILCMINSTSLIMYFFLYFYYLLGTLKKENCGGAISNEGKNRHSRWELLKKGAKTLLRKPIFYFGTVQLTVMSAVGLWLWNDPVAFGGPKSTCSHQPEIILFNHHIPLDKGSNTTGFIFAYIFLLVPGLNIFLATIPALIVGLVFYAVRLWAPKGKFAKCFYSLAFAMLAQGAVNIILIHSVERTLRVNATLIQKGDITWGFGQVLALVLVLVPLWSVLEILWAHFNKPSRPKV